MKRLILLLALIALGTQAATITSVDDTHTVYPPGTVTNGGCTINGASVSNGAALTISGTGGGMRGVS